MKSSIEVYIYTTFRPNGYKRVFHGTESGFRAFIKVIEHRPGFIKWSRVS